jgi:hypothetical protein
MLKDFRTELLNKSLAISLVLLNCMLIKRILEFLILCTTFMLKDFRTPKPPSNNWSNISASEGKIVCVNAVIVSCCDTLSHVYSTSNTTSEAELNELNHDSGLGKRF